MLFAIEPATKFKTTPRYKLSGPSSLAIFINASQMPLYYGMGLFFARFDAKAENYEG